MTPRPHERRHAQAEAMRDACIRAVDDAIDEIEAGEDVPSLAVIRERIVAALQDVEP